MSFASIHGTHNHTVVGDLIWMIRFSGKKVSFNNFDAILYEDFEELWSSKLREDDRIEAFAAGIDKEFLDGTVREVRFTAC